jgi:hypothetical protein
VQYDTGMSAPRLPVTGSLFSVAAALLLTTGVGCTAASTDDEGVSQLAASELRTTPEEAGRVLFLSGARPASCAGATGDALVRCFIGARYDSDPAARQSALTFFADTGGVAGVAPAEEMDGGYRGTIHVVPELPVGAYAKHLTWVAAAMHDFGALFAALAPSASAPIHYRWDGINFRFFRSVGRTTPSAYVEGHWEVFYNVSGSLVTSSRATRETLFHEIFHINETAHGEWATQAHAPIVNAIAAKCGTTVSCLAPYAPTDTKVAGGTYYAFHPGNGPLEVEYSAELATRYFEEQRATLAHEQLTKRPFKCGPPENRRAWDLLVTEFFGGADVVPACDP